MDDSKIEGLQERLFTELNGAMSILNMYIGDRLGLFAALVETGPVTAEAFAGRTGLNERYIREWLECMAAGEYLDYAPRDSTFSLSPEHAVVFTDPDHPSSGMGVFGWLSSFTNILPKLMEAFRTGAGVPYEEYGIDMVNGQGLFTRPMFIRDYVETWIPAMPDIQSRLQAGGRVAEVGCGIGWSAIAVARAFPNIQVDGIDPDEVSLVEARKLVAEAGVSDQITFHSTTVENAPVRGPYDLVTAFECLHDMPYPVQALARMRELAAPNGAVLIADEAVGETLEENTNFMGHLFYNFSVLHCLPQAMGFPGSAQTGTVIKPSTIRRYAEEAGFSGVDVLDIENPQFRFYRLNP